MNVNLLGLSNKIDLLRSDMLDILSKQTNQTEILENKNNSSSNSLNILNCVEREGAYFSSTGRCYVHSKTTAKWDDARAECKKNGGDLATNGNQDTYDFLVNNVNIPQNYCSIGGQKNLFSLLLMSILTLCCF